jgi:hypothetical protein
VLGTVEALVSTGDIRLIRNDSLRSAITSYLDAMRLVITINESIATAYLRRYEGYTRHFDLGRAAQVALSSEELDSLARSDYLFAYAPNTGPRPYPDPAGMLDDLELHAVLRDFLDTRGDFRHFYEITVASTRRVATLVDEELGR